METTMIGTTLNKQEIYVPKDATETKTDKLWSQLQFNYFSVIAFTLTVSSCLGGITAMFIHQNEAPIWQLSIAIFASMFNNLTAIASTPIRWVVGSFITSVSVNILLILLNIF